MGLKEKQGIARIHIHEEHEIRVQQQVDPVNGNGQQEQKQQTPGQIPEVRPDIPAGCQHDRVGRQENMYRKTVQMHEITERQCCPSGEE